MIAHPTASFRSNAGGHQEAADLVIYTDDAGRSSSHMDIEEEAVATAVPDQCRRE
jgi:hypothetical protein